MSLGKRKKRNNGVDVFCGDCQRIFRSYSDTKEEAVFRHSRYCTHNNSTAHHMRESCIIIDEYDHDDSFFTYEDIPLNSKEPVKRGDFFNKSEHSHVQVDRAEIASSSSSQPQPKETVEPIDMFMRRTTRHLQKQIQGIKWLNKQLTTQILSKIHSFVFITRWS